jgi:hypothetical protein
MKSISYFQFSGKRGTSKRRAAPKSGPVREYEVVDESGHFSYCTKNYGRQIKAMQTTFQKKFLMPGDRSISIANDLHGSRRRTTAGEVEAYVNMFDNPLRSYASESPEMIGNSVDRTHSAIV